MLASATNTASVSSSALSLSPLTLNTIVHIFLDTLIISHTFLTLLIPLIISLFYFSTPQSRRQPVFILNVVAILLAVAVGVLNDGVAIHTILEPQNPWPTAVNIAIGFLGAWQSLLVDFILLLRVIFVYPLSQIGAMRFSLLIAIPVLLKLVRIINIILFTNFMADAVNQPDGEIILRTAFSATAYIKIEWAAQMLDNTYASLVFLQKLQCQRSKRIRSNSNIATLTQRMRTLFKIALTNFLVPTVFSIVLFVCVYHNVDSSVLQQIILVNTMLATFGVAFATIWAGSANRREAQDLESKRNSHMNHSGAVLTVTFGRSVNSTQTSDDCGVAI